jgi:hypothetical protein
MRCWYCSAVICVWRERACCVPNGRMLSDGALSCVLWAKECGAALVCGYECEVNCCGVRCGGVIC